MERIKRIEESLRAKLTPSHLELVDESHLHRGHAGAKTGLGHFRVVVVAEVFAGKPLLARHQLVYSALGDLMKTDIHAMSIVAKAPGEAK